MKNPTLYGKTPKPAKAPKLQSPYEPAPPAPATAKERMLHPSFFRTGRKK